MEGHKRLRCSNYKKDEDVIFISYYMNGGGTVTIDLPTRVIKYWLWNNGYLNYEYISITEQGKLAIFETSHSWMYFWQNYMNKDIMEVFLNHPPHYAPLKTHYIEKWII